MGKQKDSKETGNSENGESEKSEEYVRFENAAKIVFRHTPKVEKSPAPKDPDEKRKDS